MSTRTALIVIGTYKQAWFGLSPVAQSDFITRVGAVAKAAGLAPEMGYRLPATPGAFIEIWEGADHAAVERAVQDLHAMGYTRYVDARWIIGERETQTVRIPKIRKKVER